MLLLHIIVALISLAVSTYGLFKPSQTPLRISYGLIGATTLSGLGLVIMNPAQTLHACMMYLVYAAAVSVLAYRANTRLATAAHSTSQ